MELVVNSHAVARQEIAADGGIQDLTFDYKPRLLKLGRPHFFPACHTNPSSWKWTASQSRASEKSAQWCVGRRRNLLEEERTRHPQGREKNPPNPPTTQRQRRTQDSGGGAGMMQK